jgi:glycosyltransferase involved in cell wall biosynthesis
MPKVSVIIPTYNYGKYIKKAIDSVLAQTYRDFEIIVVDDGSTDNTRQIVNNIKSKKIRYLYKENGGPGSARNYALREASGDLLAFLDADDFFHPENIATKVGILNKRKEVDWVFSDVYFVTPEDTNICLGSEYFKMVCSSELFERKSIFDALLSEGNFISTATIMVRHKCFDIIGPFDESQLMHQDYLQWLYLSNSFPNYIYIDNPLAYMTRHPTSWGNIKKKSLEERLKLYAKIEKRFKKELHPFRNSWKGRTSDAYNRLGIIEMSKSKGKALKCFLKSLMKKPLQKFAYLYLARTIWK